MKTIWTIGHSTHSLEEFIGMLKSFDIELVADIRSLPGSRKFPQFDREALEESLPANGIAYRLIPQLGGRRKVRPDSPNTAWRHPAFRGYADYMETPGFREGIDQLSAEAEARRTALLCAEAVWWRCHRSMVADYLKSNGFRVWHIMGVDKAEEHPYTSAARLVDGVLTYHER